MVIHGGIDSTATIRTTGGHPAPTMTWLGLAWI
jgi:hypothetical protein